MMLPAALLFTALITVATAANLPTAAVAAGTFFYASSPTQANETFLLLGGPAPSMLSTAYIRVCAGTSNCTFLLNEQPTAVSAKAVLPASLPLDVFSAASCTSAEASSCAPPSALVNAPRVAWQQGDADEASATQDTGYVRLFGTALAFSPPPLSQCVPTLQGASGAAGAQLSLLPAAGGGAPIPLSLSFASCFAITAPIPASTPPGDYILQLSNGLPSCGLVNASASGATLLLRVVPPAPWPTQVFDVVAMGSVWAALAAAAANDGGTVFFPRGRYVFDENSTLNAIPPRTTLLGEGTDLVELYWKDMAAGPRRGNNLTSMVQGLSGNFALRNLTLYVQGNYSVPVISDGGFDGLVVAGVIVRANPYYMMLEPVNQSFHGRSMAVGSGFNSGAAVGVSGCRWAVTDSDLLGGSHAIDIFVSDAPTSWYQRPCNGLLARSTLVGGFGMYRLEGARGVILEDNVMRGGGLNSFGSWMSTYYAKATSGIYFARNRVESVMGGDRELLSFDGGGGAYLGGVASTSADGLVLTLSGDPVFAGYIPPGPKLFNYTEAAVCVLEGAGAGQVGRVASNDWAPGGTNKSWALQTPFAVPLDSTSVISIVPFRGDVIITANTFTDGGAIQLYAMAIGVVVSENVATRASRFMSWGLNPCVRSLASCVVRRTSRGASDPPPLPHPPSLQPQLGRPAYILYILSQQYSGRGQCVGWADGGLRDRVCK